MSDTAQSSAVALLKPSIGSSKYSATSIPRFNSDKSPGNSFSSELTRAADNAEVKRHQPARSEGDRLDQSEQGQTDKTRRSRDEYRTERSGSETSQPEDAQQSAISSSKEATSKSNETTAHANRADRPASQSVEDNNNNGAAADNPVSENDDIAEAAAPALHSADAKELESSSTERPAYTSTMLADEGNLNNELSDVAATAIDTVDAVVSGSRESASGENNAGLSAVELQLEKSAVQDEVAEMSGAKSGTLSSETMPAGANGVANKMAVLPGEQITPAELASRQAHFVGQSVPRQGNTASSLQDANLAADPDSEVEALRVTGGNVSTVTAGTIKTAQTVDSATQQLISSSPQLTSPSLEPRTASIQEVAENLATDEDLKTADLKAAAELDAKLVARNIEQKVTQTNLAQAQLQAQQQVELASINPATTIAAGDIADSDKLSADNMLLSSSGGIVTAPLLQRAEAGSTQTITAPLNVPVLQGDAEKAMTGNIRWMVNEGVKNAVIHVTPSGMGPISVRVVKEKDHINVSIVALQGSTREALDSMLPRLREQLAAQGHDSVRVDISDGRSGQSDRGYGQQGSAERQAMENQSRLSSRPTDSAQEDLMSERQVEGVDRTAQGLMTVDLNGQVRSRYDVYV